MSFFRLSRFLLPENRHLESQLEVFRKELEDAGRRLDAIPFLNGKLVEGLSFPSAANLTVYHGLGRVPRGWIIVRDQVQLCVLYEVSRDANTIVLHSNFAATLDVWFF